MAGPRRRKIGHRRRVEDEGEDDLDLDDDSLTDGSLASDDDDHANDSDTSNVDEVSPTSPATKKAGGTANSNGTAKAGVASSAPVAGSDTEKLSKSTSLSNSMSGLSISEQPGAQESGQGEDVNDSTSASKSGAPIVVSSAIMDQPQDGQPFERRRREHDEYRRRRDEDPSFVPNRERSSCTITDTPALPPMGSDLSGEEVGVEAAQVHNTADPTVSAPWAHDMHEIVTEPAPSRQPRHTVAHSGHSMMDDGPPNGDGFIPTCPSNATPINRTLSCEKHIGNVQVRVFLPQYKEPVVFSGHAVKQYTSNACGASLDLGLGRSAASPRRTSVFGGSYYNGSVYSPSVALSRRSSIAPDLGRDYLLSPTGSAISRPPMPLDAARPVVRLPPRVEPPPVMNAVGMGEYPADGAAAGGQTTINDLPQPQIHPLPAEASGDARE
ncbi:CASC3/Barentsz eIF4AIII binding-domain-containing protein [Apiospora hydei]|uniref:CASC3/Barentsz eIF4AIII binding-domain-containing protein n=1 Tax=Apiospora hydei TaxID=1337664 RepID=A0ABR1WRK3_9PEZI